MSPWVAVLLAGSVNLAGLAFAAGAVVYRLKRVEKDVEEAPAAAEKAAAHLDLEHLYECHPRTAKRRTSEMQEVDP